MFWVSCCEADRVHRCYAVAGAASVSCGALPNAADAIELIVPFLLMAFTAHHEVPAQ